MKLSFALLLSLGFALGAPAGRARPETAPANAKDPAGLLARPTVIGASVSAGFTRLGGDPHPVSESMERAIAAPHAAVAGVADFLFFTSASPKGKQQVDAALAKNPTIVFAVDFLFWYGYGSLPDEDARLELLEKGLAEVDRIPCPVIVGDFPDASEAVGKILKAAQVPKKETLAKLNARLAKWAAERPRVAVVRLSEWLPKLLRADDVSLRGNRWDGGASGRLLHTDRLHLTEEGTAALAVILLDSAAKFPNFPETGVRFDVAALLPKASSLPKTASAPAAPAKK